MVRMEQYKRGEHVITMAIDSVEGLPLTAASADD